MGEIADMILDGILDEETGEYIGPGVGYLRSLNPKHWSNQMQGNRQPNAHFGVVNWLTQRNCPVDPEQVIRKYQDEVLHIEGVPKTKNISKRISKDFKAFTDWYGTIKKDLK